MKQTYLVIVAVALLGMAIITVAPLTRKKQAVATSQTSTAATTTQSSTNNTTQTTSTPVDTTSTTSSTPVATPTNSSGLKDGTFKGKSVMNDFGKVQVSIVINAGKITDVIFNSLPNSERRSQQINSVASPLLKQQTIAAQSANIDGVSGATYTSYSYVDSLQSAIDSAKI